MQKFLPNGTFISIRHLPADATEEAVAEWLAQCLPITAEQVSVDYSRHGPEQSAMVAIDKEATCHLLKWAFEGLRFPGASSPVAFVPFGKRR